jgi:hypothetical protein
MSQLVTYKALLGDPPESDALLQFYLDSASDIICDLRDSIEVETKYLTLQIKMAVEMYNKRGAEGQTGHTENGISRVYSKADVSDSLLSQVIPMIKTPYSDIRV